MAQAGDLKCQGIVIRQGCGITDQQAAKQTTLPFGKQIQTSLLAEPRNTLRQPAQTIPFPRGN